MRRLACLLLLLLLASAACGARGVGSPTPFPTPAATPSATAAGPITLTVTELAAAPGLYVDAVVQVSGLFHKQPILVCDSEPHPSPATWGLAEAGLVAPAGGYDQQVRGLLPEGLFMTVEGRWRRWEGLVGCGKQAATREVWYLDVARVLSPSPLVQVTLTPGAPGTAVAEVSPTPSGEEPVPTEDPSLFPTPLPEELTPTPDFAAEPTDEFDDFPEEPFPTEPFPPTEEAEPIGGVSPTATTSGTPAGTTTPGASGTPTITGTPPTATPTVTGTPPTATPTVPGGSGGVDAKGDLRDLEGDFVTSNVASGRTDSWDMEIFEEEDFTLYVIAAAPADVVVTLLKDGQTIVNRQNTAAPGLPEIIPGPTDATEGLYELHVSVQNGTATDYAVLLNTDFDLPYSVSGMLAPTLPHTGVQLPRDLTHVWFFHAEVGDQVTILLDPSGGDVYIDLYEPDGVNMESIDEGFDGESETLQWSVTVTGLHAVFVAEYEGATISYDLTMTVQ